MRRPKEEFLVDEVFVREVIGAIEAGESAFAEYQMAITAPTRNGATACKWNYINEELQRWVSSERYSCFVEKVGCWQFILIYDVRNCICYVLTRIGNYKKLQKNPEKYKLHYLAALASVNRNLRETGIIPQLEQGALWEEDKDSEVGRSEKQKKLTRDLPKVDIVAFVLFDTYDLEVKDIQVVVATERFGYWWQKDCTPLVTAVYKDAHTVSASMENGNMEENENTEPVVNLHRRKFAKESAM